MQRNIALLRIDDDDDDDYDDDDDDDNDDDDDDDDDDWCFAATFVPSDLQKQRSEV